MEAVKQVFFGCALVRRIDFWYCNRFPSILDFIKIILNPVYLFIRYFTSKDSIHLFFLINNTFNFLVINIYL